MDRIYAILSEPHSGFRIAFNMFDTDGNNRVDRQEFLVVCRICFITIFNIYINYNRSLYYK